MNEYMQAKIELKQAWQNFNEATDSELVDAAIYALRAAELRMQNVTKELAKRQECEAIKQLEEKINEISVQEKAKTISTRSLTESFTLRQCYRSLVRPRTREN